MIDVENDLQSCSDFIARNYFDKMLKEFEGLLLYIYRNTKL